MNKIVRDPHAILLPAQNASQLKRIADVEAMLKRQLGFVVKFDIVKDKTNKEYAIAGWEMSKKEYDVIRMLIRWKQKPGKPVNLTASEHEPKTVAKVKEEKELTKKAL